MKKFANRLLITTIPFFFLTLFSSTAFTQTRSEIAAQLSRLINSSSYADDIQYYSNVMDQACNTFSHTYDSYQSVRFDKTEKFARVTSAYKNIPWGDLAFITQERIFTTKVFIVFNEPIVQSRKFVHGPYFKDKHKDFTSDINVKSIHLMINRKDMLLFESLCFKLKQLDSPPISTKPLPTITSLPNVAYCQTVPPPTRKEVSVLLLSATFPDRTPPKEWRSYYHDFFKLAGLDISKMELNELRANAPRVQQYWNSYAHSFTTGSWNQLSGSSNNSFMNVNQEALMDDAWYLIARLIKGNVNILNPYNGRTYLDYLSADYFKEEQYIEPDVEQLKGKWMLFDDRLKKFGFKSASAMINEYRFDPVAHQSLIEAIVCNSQGDGVLSGLKNDPEQYLLFIYRMGLRNFEEAVFIFEKIHQVSISLGDQTKYRKTLKGENLLWD